MGLKTSDQIYHQLRWDPGIPEERVIIVYDDHLVGLRPVAFSEFTPGGRIPWGRLWRFELDGEVIWDRKARIDRVRDVRQQARKGLPDEGFFALPVWRFEGGEWQPWKGPGAALPERCTAFTLNVLFNDHKPERINTPRRTEALLAMLHERQPTLIALQEVKIPLLEALLASDWVRENYFLSDGPRGDTIRPYGQLLLSRMPPDRLQQIRFSHSKRAIVATFSPGLSIAVVHLTSDRGRDAAVRRAEQLHLLVSGLSGDALIIGDLNFGDEYTEPMLSDFLDVWPALNPGHPGITYDPGENALAAEMSPGSRTRRLDRVLLRSSPERVLPTEITLEGTEPLSAAAPPLFLSDHYALQCVLQLGAADRALSSSPTTHHTAAVVLPPRSSWPTLQSIRRAHDPSFERWMPHINLLYGFLAEPLMDAAAARLAPVLAAHPSLTITLDRIGRFNHGSTTTLYLAPDRTSERALVALQRAMQAVLPQCTEQDRDGRFTPHLTLAKCRSTQADAVQSALESEGIELSFDLDAIDLISRRRAEPFASRLQVFLATGSVGRRGEERRSLPEMMGEAGVVMTPGQQAARDRVVKRLSAVIGGPVFVMGSARLGVHGPQSDLDVLGVSARSLAHIRQRVLETFGGRAVDAVVPIIKLTLEGVAVDLLLARYPGGVPLVDPGQLTPGQRARLSRRDARAAIGCLEADAILDSVGEHRDAFRLALSTIRAWASARQIDSHALGYPGGLSWALLLASTPPHREADAWMEAMFSRLLEWDWSQAIGLSVPPDFMTTEVVCVLTSVEPRVNSVRNAISTTLTILQDELARGLERLWEIREGRRSWNMMLDPVGAMADPARIELSISGVSGSALRSCQGWLSGRILGLLIDLERRPGLPMRPYSTGGRFDLCVGLLRAPQGEERLKVAESVSSFIERFRSWDGRPEPAELRWKLVG